MHSSTVTIPSLSPLDVAGTVKAIRDDGLAFFPNLIDKSLAEETCRKIDQLTHLEHDGNSKNGKDVDHFKCVFNRDPYWLQFLDLPGIIDSAEELMGDQCHIIGMSAWRSFPGSGGKYIHSDQIFVPMDEELLLSGRVHLPVFISTLHFYLVDIDIDLCPTYVIPGSHKSGRGPSKVLPKDGNFGTVNGDETSWNGVEEMPVLCNAGDGMLFRSEVWHGGSKNNTTDRVRYLLQVHYAQRGIAQRFNPYLNFKHNPDVSAAANERQLRLLGKHNISAYG